jgi:AraC family transcriptional regulator
MDDPSQAYRARFRKVLEYIDAHASEPLSVELLSRVAAFSKHHFHRQFCALFDLGVHEYVRAVRLKRASDQLGFRYWRSVLEVALDSGYHSPEAFARAFKKHFGQTPSQFQSSPDWRSRDQLHATLQTIRTDFMAPQNQLSDVRVIDFPETKVAVLEHLGDPALIHQTVRRFIEWRRTQAGLRPAASTTFNIFWSDPEVTGPENYRMDVCAGTNQPVPPNDFNIVAKTIPAGRCAVLRHIGPDPLDASIRFLYRDWLPTSGETPRDYPLFAQRVALPPQVQEHEAMVDIHLPLTGTSRGSQTPTSG